MKKYIYLYIFFMQIFLFSSSLEVVRSKKISKKSLLRELHLRELAGRRLKGFIPSSLISETNENVVLSVLNRCSSSDIVSLNSIKCSEEGCNCIGSISYLEVALYRGFNKASGMLIDLGAALSIDHLVLSTLVSSDLTLIEKIAATLKRKGYSLNEKCEKLNKTPLEASLLRTTNAVECYNSLVELGANPDLLSEEHLLLRSARLWDEC